MAQSYVWLVTVFEKKLIGWRERNDMRRTFTNKVRAMEYQQQVNRNKNMQAHLQKWFGR